MNEILFMVLAFTGGIALGILFFYGLWLTVRKAVASGNPALWFLGSSVARTVIALGGFYFIARGSWQRLLICVAGFITARYIVKNSTQRQQQNAQAEKGVVHEP
jgi:F1F0 ATPase subunit 2